MRRINTERDFAAYERAWENSQEEAYHQACAEAEMEEALHAEERRKDQTHHTMLRFVDRYPDLEGYYRAGEACDAAAEDRWPDAVAILRELADQDWRWVPLRDLVIAADHEPAEGEGDY